MKPFTLTLIGALALGLAGCGSTPTSGRTPHGSTGQVTLETFSNSPIISPTGASVELDFAAFQDGDGSWQPLTRANGKYSFTVKDPKGRYAVAYRCPITSQYGNGTTQLLTLTTGEVQRPVALCHSSTYDPTTPRVNLTVNVTGAPRGGSLGITEVGGQPRPFQGSLTSFTAESGTGSGSLRKGLVNVGVTAAGDDAAPARMAIIKNVDVQADKTISVDMNSQGFALERRRLTVQGASTGEEAQLFHSFSDGAPNTSATVLAGIFSEGWSSAMPTSLALDLVPTARQTPTSLHYLELRSLKRLNQYDSNRRSAIAFLRQPRDLTLTLPAAPAIKMSRVATAGKTALNTDFGTSNLSIAIVSGYTSDGTMGSFNQVSVMVTKGWLNGKQQFSLPDLSAVQGWKASWNLDTAGQVSWYGAVIQSTSTVAAHALMGTDAAIGDYAALVSSLDGAVVTSATVQGTLNPLP